MPLMPVASVVTPSGTALTLIYDSTLGADGSFDVTGIPATYKHLQVVLSLRSTKAASAGEAFRMRFNNDSGANYYNQYLDGFATSALAGQEQGASGAYAECVAATGTAGFFTALTGTVVDYANTSRKKSFLYETSDLRTLVAAGIQRFSTVSHWNDTSAINRFQVVCEAGNVLAGSRLTIYGMG